MDYNMKNKSKFMIIELIIIIIFLYFIYLIIIFAQDTIAYGPG